jgi:predicted short-subunit dehydrogenase-like oxidoreductase (DUF2520 family)
MALKHVAIFGMGRFGRALASELARVGVATRMGGRGRAPGGDDVRQFRTPAEFLDGLAPGALIVMSVRDDAIAEVAAQFAALPGAAQHMFVHNSGASGLGVVKALADKGVPAGVFHILQSLPPEQRGGRIAGSYAAIAGPQGLIAVLRELAARVQVTPVELSEGQWAAYHAAAVLASNALLGLLETGRGILKDAGISPEQAGKMLIPLVEGTLKNAQEFDLPMALTGPVVRGDVGTIKRHLDVLQGDARDTYKAVMRAVIGLAERAGRTPPGKLDEIRKLL